MPVASDALWAIFWMIPKKLETSSRSVEMAGPPAFCRDLSRVQGFNPDNRNMAKAKLQRPTKNVNRKGLPAALPTFVQKSYFMLGGPERDLLNQALSKYRPGRSEPILIGSEKLLKPALKLMSFYRLRIDEIKEATVVTSYTRWLEAVIVNGTENQEVYVTFSPQFERIWLESKKRLPEHVAKEPANIGLRSQYSIRLYAWAKKWASVGTKRIHWKTCERYSGWSWSKMRREESSKSLHFRSGQIFARGHWMLGSRRLTGRRT